MVWIKRIFLGIVALLVLFIAGVYLRSEYVLRKTYEAPLRTVIVPSDSASIAEGQRLASTYGCTGCHGASLEGRVFFEDPMVGRFVAPNLTRVALEQSDAELERVIRHAVRANGRSTLAMPSGMYQHLSDRDLGTILAYMRSLPASDGPATEVKAGVMARLGIALGMYDLQVTYIDPEATPPADRPVDTLAVGEYLAMTACTECHGQDLTGGFDGTAPDLVIAAAYTGPDFAHFMSTGEATGGRELDMMSGVARYRFSHFTEAEVHALHAYLLARAEERNAAPIAARAE